MYATKVPAARVSLVYPSIFFFFTPAIQLIVDINNIREGAKGWTHERGTRNMLLPLLYCVPQDIVQ